MTPLEVIHKLKEAKNVKEKETIIAKAWEDGSDDFFEGIQYAFDPFSSFGVTEVPYILDEDDEPDEVGMKKFTYLLNQLRRRWLIELAAEDAIADLCDIAGVEDWNEWYRKILLKNFKGIITAHQANKVLKKLAKTEVKAIKYIIPHFGIQKPNSHDGKYLVGYSFIDHHINGKRTVALLNKDYNSTTLLDEKGNEFLNDSVFDSLTKLLHKLPIGIVLDGVVKDDHYIIFDILPLDEYRKGYTHRSQEQRHEALCDLEIPLQDISERKLRVHPKKKINLKNEEEFKRYCDEAKSEGVTHVVIKDCLAPYLTKKSDNWIKLPLDIK